MRNVSWVVVVLAGAAPASSQEAFVLEPIIVNSASRDARALLDTPVAASIREGESLEERQATDFQQLIGDVPGLTIEGGPRPIAQEPNIRGFQDEQIVLRFDGARFNFNQAHRGRFFVDPDIVQRVEVVRGGGSTLFGSGALGGVISVETKDVDDLLAPEDSFGARFLGGYASNGEIGRATATLYGRTDQFDALGFIGYQPMGRDFEDGSDVDIGSSELDILNGLFKLGFEPNEANRLEFNTSFYQDEGTVPPNASDDADPDTDVDRDADVFNVSLGWEFVPEGSSAIDLSVLAYFSDLEITEDRDTDGRDDKTTYKTYGFEAVNRSEFDAGVPWDLVYGIEFLRDTQEGTRNGETREQFPDATADTYSAFAEATVQITNWLAITPGLRYDRYMRDPDSATDPDVDDDFWSPRLGVSIRPNDNWQIYGNVARAFRAPSLTELYNDDVHFAYVDPRSGRTIGTNDFVPNPDLETEKSTQYEIGTRYISNGVLRSNDSLSLSANAYYAQVEDFIDTVVSAPTFSFGRFGPELSGTTTTRNIDADLWGFEAEASYDAGVWFSALGITLPRGDADDGSNLGSIPQDRLSITLGARPGAGWELGGTAIFASDQDDVPEGSDPGEAWTVVNLFASWRPQLARTDDFVIRAGIDNLFDETYSIYPTSLNQPGRSFKVSAAVTF